MTIKTIRWKRTEDDRPPGARTFVGAFQSMDKAIINPWFMATFFGALVLTALAAALHLSGDITDLAAVRRHFGEARWSAWNVVAR